MEKGKTSSQVPTGAWVLQNLCLPPSKCSCKSCVFRGLDHDPSRPRASALEARLLLRLGVAAASSPRPGAGSAQPRISLGSPGARAVIGRRPPHLAVLSIRAGPQEAPLRLRPTAHPLWKGGSLNVAQIIAGTQANCRLLLAHKLSGTFEIDPHYPKRHP